MVDDYSSPASLEAAINGCQVCFARAPGITKPPPMQRGSYSADIMVVGEAPGRTEVKSGVAFSGRAGSVLKTWLLSAGLMESDIAERLYLTSLIKCCPQENIEDFMIGNCYRFLKAQINLVKPRILLPLGNKSISFFLSYNDPLTGVIGNKYDEDGLRPTLFKRLPEYTVLIPLPHPSPINAWYKKNTQSLDRALTVLQEELERINHEV